MVNSRRRFLGKGLTCVTGIMAGSYLHANALKQDESEHWTAKPETLPAINSGIGGNNTIDLLNRIEKDCLAHRPKLTILMAGTNDMNSVKYVPAAEYERNLSVIAGRIVSAGSQLLIMTILPAYEPYLLTRHPASFYEPEGVAGRRKQVNAIIKKTAGDHKAVLLDMEQRFTAIGNVGTSAASLIQNEVNAGKTDGVHPTPNGYRFIALSVFDCIVCNDLPREQIVCFGDSITRGDGSNDRNSYPGFLNKLLTTV
ncbi:SGNH/GDSL hydrolase family protein [Niabella beijingensis]|uniref:SGNH/GDSL hydrolase family protein n=1 Tax=Niabella beijingensis TaxID=2872700 RepID=UPI001CC15314|nr:SGNH/GDSL hydrolase family protein [Niabella beijingensis]MBZ4191405.1 SGNH/GDSL hydrolase family protein [Niabella beijingensis]